MAVQAYQQQRYGLAFQHFIMPRFNFSDSFVDPYGRFADVNSL
jgi:hypothetical protein